METTKVGIREFRSGLAEYIASDKPVAVTRHGHTVGVFIPTPGPLQEGLAAFKEASTRLASLMPLSEEEVQALASAFDTERKAKAGGRRVKG